MLYCSSECGSISIMQLRTIYCNAHVYTFHVCLYLLVLTFVCNSTYLVKCSFQIYQRSIVVFIRSITFWAHSLVWLTDQIWLLQELLQVLPVWHLFHLQVFGHLQVWEICFWVDPACLPGHAWKKFFAIVALLRFLFLVAFILINTFILEEISTLGITTSSVGCFNLGNLLPTCKSH